MNVKSEIRNPKFEAKRVIAAPIRLADRILGFTFQIAGLLALALVLLPGSELVLQAQPAGPRIGYVHPAGGQQGTTFQVAVGGQFLDGVTAAYFSGEGIEAVFVEFNKPMPPNQFNQLRDKLRELQEKRQAALRDSRRRDGSGGRSSTNSWTAADEKQFNEIRDKILKNPPNRQATPAIAETVTLKVTVATNAVPGEREIRLAAPNGLSNPLVFCVGQLPEFTQPLAKATNPEADRLRRMLGRQPAEEPAKTVARITLPVIINGQIMPGRVDRFRFTARRGQELVAAVSARALIPYLADAVPGWFQATLALYDAKGNELAYDDDFRFQPDPVLHYTIPKDGEYSLEIKDAIYRGREDFVYRISLGELPFVTGVFPLGARVGSETTVELKGWNLSETRLTPDTSSPGLLRLRAGKPERLSNPVPFAVDNLPEILEQEPNNAAARAQLVSLPVIINGRMDVPGDTDVFGFEGRAGDDVVAEIHARRLASPLDSSLKLTDGAGRQLAFNDDFEDKGSGLNTHHADSYLRATLPADGAYFVHLTDTQRQGGDEFAYRLRLSAPQPDFALRVVPSSLSVRGGTSVPLTVFALRRDGFTNPIALKLKDAPSGFVLGGASVPANQDQVRLTLAAPPSPTDHPLVLELEGRAVVEGRLVVRPAIPADDMMQAFAYRHLVPARELSVAVSGRFMPRSAIRILGESPLKIPAGGTARVQIGFPVPRFAEQLQLELDEPVEGISIQKVSPARDGAELVLQCDAAKVRPGLSGNLIVNAYSSRFAEGGKEKKQPGARRNSLGTLPAIPFEIVAAQ